jgi:hypothetical protein
VNWGQQGRRIEAGLVQRITTPKPQGYTSIPLLNP